MAKFESGLNSVEDWERKLREQWVMSNLRLYAENMGIPEKNMTDDQVVRASAQQMNDFDQRIKSMG